MYCELLDFLRLRIDIVVAHEIANEIECGEELPQVNPHFAKHLENLLQYFVEENFDNPHLGEQFLNWIDIQELLQDL